MSKIKLVTAGVLALVVGVGVGTAQPPKPAPPPAPRSGEIPLGKFGAAPDKDTDEAFIRRVSKDLRGTDPTPAEVHFFLASKDANRRTTLVDLFVKERTAKEAGRADRLGERVNEHAQLDAIRRYAETLQLARAREQEARALAEKAAAEQARARAIEAERAALDAIEAQRREVLRRAEAERAAAEKAREKANGQTPAAPQPARPTEKGFRTGDPKAEPKAPHVTVPVPATQPGLPPPITTGDTRNTVPALPVPAQPATPAPAANVEVLKVRVQLAELTVREKTLAARQLEEQVKRGVVPVGELDRAKLDVERSQLLLREAQLLLEQAERTTPRAVPPATRP